MWRLYKNDSISNDHKIFFEQPQSTKFEQPQKKISNLIKNAT